MLSYQHFDPYTHSFRSQVTWPGFAQCKGTQKQAPPVLTPRQNHKISHRQSHHFPYLCKEDYFKTLKRNWRDSAMIKSKYCSCKGPSLILNIHIRWLTPAHHPTFWDSAPLLSPRTRYLHITPNNYAHNQLLQSLNSERMCSFSDPMSLQIKIQVNC